MTASDIAARSGPAATFRYDGANRLTGDGTRSFVWDGADRLVRRGTDTFSYDALGRMVAAALTIPSPRARTLSATYAYDGDGLLRSRSAEAETTTYLWDPTRSPAPLLAAGSERIVQGLGPLYRVDAHGIAHLFLRDRLGSVRAEVSGVGPTAAYDYTAYGDLAAAVPGAPLLGFAGELRDPSAQWTRRAP